MSAAAAVYCYATIVALGFAFLLAQIPVQVSDCLGNIASAFSSTWHDLLVGPLGSRGFFRPLINPPTKLVLDVAPGREFAAFRAIHVVQVLAAFWLFARALRVRTWAAAAGALVAVAVFSGSHTFVTLVNEGYPINTYLTVALCALVTLNVVTEERPRWWTDALVIAAFLVALGTIETGLLIWVAVAAGALAGYRGVSRPAVAVLTALVAAYFALRFLVLDVGTPDLMERESGYLLERLSPAQLTERFGANPFPLYAYNVASSLGTLFLGDPRSGTLLLARAIVNDSLRPWMVVSVVSNVAITVLVAWYAWTCTWRQAVSQWTYGQRMLFVAAGVIAANAVISFPYVKDQVMTVAGIYMAAAAAVAVGGLVHSPPRPPFARVAALLLIALAATTWCWRVVGVQHSLTHAAVAHRNDWASVDPAAVAEREHGGPELAALIASLRDAAITRTPAYPHVWSPPFMEEWFEH